MNLRSHRTALCLVALLSATASAQVSTWIAPGTSLTPRLDWFDPANWDNGVVPNDPTAVAALHVFTPGQISSSFPQAGGASPAFTGNVSLAEIRILTTFPATTTAAVPTLHIGQPGGPASSLDLFGPGFATTGPNSLIPVGVFVSNGSLTFHNQASAIFNRFTLSSGATLTFADQSSAGPSMVDFGTPGERLIVRDTADISQLRVTGQGLIDLSGATQNVAVTSINGTIDINLGATRLTLDRLPNNSIAFLNGKISGTGGLAFTSTTNSILVIGSAANDYTGDTLISSNPARVVFAGTRVNNVRVTNNALVNIGSFATVTGRLDLTFGRLQINDGGVPAMLTVQGDYTQGADSQLTLNTAFQPSLVVSGTATLAGRLTPIAIPASAQLGSARFLLISAGQVVGRFDPSFPVGFGTSLTRSLSLAYTATEVALQVTQLPFANLGTTPSQRATGANLDANLPTATGGFRSLLIQLNNSNNAVAFAAALGELSPDTYGALVEEDFAAAAVQQSRFDTQFAFLRAEGAGRGFSFFAGAHDRRDRYHAIAGLWDTSHDSSGGLAGGIWRSGPWAAGLTFGQEKTSALLDPFGSKADTDARTTGFLVQHTAGNFFQNASVAYTANRFTLRRRVVFPSFDQTATAAPGGARTDFAVNAGYTAAWRNWRITPAVGLLGSRWKMDDFAESGGGAAALSFHDWSADSLRSRAGLQVSYLAGHSARPHLDVAWLHEFESDRAIPAGLTGANTGYLSPGRPAETDLVQARLSLDFKLGRAASLYAGVSGAWGRNSRVTSDLSIGFRWAF